MSPHQLNEKQKQQNYVFIPPSDILFLFTCTNWSLICPLPPRVQLQYVLKGLNPLWFYLSPGVLRPRRLQLFAPWLLYLTFTVTHVWRIFLGPVVLYCDKTIFFSHTWSFCFSLCSSTSPPGPDCRMNQLALDYKNSTSVRVRMCKQTLEKRVPLLDVWWIVCMIKLSLQTEIFPTFVSSVFVLVRQLQFTLKQSLSI